MAERTKQKISIGSIVLIILSVLVIIAGWSAMYFYRQLSDLKKDPQKVVQEEVASIVLRVGQLMLLPEGEQPTLATVANPDQLRNQPFFANASIGDKVLFYANARKAILYNPNTNKIIEVAPINLGDTPAPLDVSSAPVEEEKVADEELDASVDTFDAEIDENL